MAFHPDCTDHEFTVWLETAATEDELRDAYLRLETKRAALWTAGHFDSFWRDRYERDARYVKRLVRIKWLLAARWAASGQFDRLDPDSVFA
jgi:hypothetical protein